MEISVNNQETTVQADLSLGDFLRSQELNELGGIAVAVNERVIAKDDWPKTALIENDKVLIIRATQGG